MNKEIYIKIDQNSKVNKKKVLLSDIATIHCIDSNVRKIISNIMILNISSDEKGVYVMTFVRIVELIHRRKPDTTVINEGEKEFIIQYDPESSSANKIKAGEYLKVAFVCFVSFFGAAFTIVAFNMDAGVKDIFDKVYYWFMNTDKNGTPSILEFSYCIGLPVGILVFFNHFSKKKLTTDPTPIHIEMRNYEKETNDALIQDASREGKTIDVS